MNAEILFSLVRELANEHGWDVAVVVDETNIPGIGEVFGAHITGVKFINGVIIIEAEAP
jgi:hypothetical protein